MSETKIGVIGCGNRSWIAFHALLEPGVIIAAGADPSQESLDKFSAFLKSEYGKTMSCYSDYREMLEKEKLDAVIICSPDSAHHEQALACMAKGVAVYLEKPVAIDLADCTDILKTSEKTGVKLQIGHNMRYMWFTNKMKELLEADAIGDVKAIWVRHFISYGDGYFRKWYAEEKNINSLLIQKGAHDIDIIHMLANSYTKRISGYGMLSVYDKLPRRKRGEPMEIWKDRSRRWPHEKMSDFNPDISINDHNMIMMQLANGIQASYMQCFFTPDTCRNYTIIGTRGRIENYGDFGEGQTQIQVWNTREDKFRLEGDITYREPRREDAGHGGADEKIIKSFMDYLLRDIAPAIKPVDAWRAAVTGICGAESIRQNNMPIEVPDYN